jgi:hypothetical protein
MSSSLRWIFRPILVHMLKYNHHCGKHVIRYKLKLLYVVRTNGHGYISIAKLLVDTTVYI